MGVLDSLVDVKGVVGKIIDTVSKHFPTPETELKRLELENALTATMLTQLAQIDIAVSQINLEEAKSTNLFKSGWRPFLAWACGAGVMLHVFIFPIVAACVASFVPPNIDVETMLVVLGSLLGMGTLRTVEKVKKVR